MRVLRWCVRLCACRWADSRAGRVYGCVDETDQEPHLRIDARTMRQLTSVRSVHLSSTALHSIIPEEPEPVRTPPPHTRRARTTARAPPR